MKRSPSSFSRALALTALLTGVAAAQVPDGYAVFGTFGGGTGQGIFFAHPRDPSLAPIPVTNLPQDLAPAGTGSRGVASLLRRPSDDAILAGERAPSGSSVDLWVLRLAGSQVTLAQSFSCGTSAGVGEIPQLALLPDGRVVVAATDLLAGGQLAHFFNNGSYHWQGLSILNTTSGAFSAVAVSNWNQFVGVINGMAVSRDGSRIWLAAYIGTASGALWEIPVAGGAMTLAAALPFGASNVTVDQDDTVLVTTLNGPPNLLRYDPISTGLTVVASSIGPMNCIAVENATGNWFVATGSSGAPPRSLYWRTPAGAETLLQNPGLATISAVDVNQDPESFGAGTPATASYAWQLSPNPGGLPEVGNDQFSLTVKSSTPMIAIGFVVFGFARLPAPVHVLGVDIVVDPTNSIAMSATLVDTATVAVPIPAVPAVRGAELFAQALFFENPLFGLAASPGVSFTVL